LSPTIEVLIASTELRPGLILRDQVPQGHKVALVDIAL
jgi:hypothetical protein